MVVQVEVLNVPLDFQFHLPLLGLFRDTIAVCGRPLDYVVDTIVYRLSYLLNSQGLIRPFGIVD